VADKAKLLSAWLALLTVWHDTRHVMATAKALLEECRTHTDACKRGSCATTKNAIAVSIPD
jgi:hypothetical protein